MTDENDDMELIHGSGNVYRDFGRPNAGLEQARTIVAAKIIGILDDRKLSTREAEKLTGVSHSDFSRIRNTQLRRFTLDRMRGLKSSGTEMYAKENHWRDSPKTLPETVS